MVVIAVAAVMWINRGSEHGTVGDTQLTWATVVAGLALATLAALWLRRPDQDFVQAFEQGNPERWRDERYHAVLGRAAVTTLVGLLILVLTAGGLHDVFVTHRWPVRSFVEAFLIVVVWRASFSWWNRRL